MNKKRLLKLADYIESSKTFDYRYLFHKDKSPADVVGHAAQLFSKDIKQFMAHELWHGNDYYIGRERLDFYHEVCLNVLDLSDAQMYDLFALFPQYYRGNYPSGKHVAKTLRNLTETGKVDWNI